MKIASLIVYSFIFRFLIAHRPMRGHIKVVQMKNYFECALECKLESNCFSWKYLEEETRCILESEYLDSINHKKSFSTNNATYVGDKNFIEHFTDHKLHAPLIMRSTTSYSFPQSFIAGCTYSISTWAWMWPSNSTQKQHIFGVIPTEPSIREVATLYPGVIFNYIRTRKFFFSFSAKDHIAEDYFGHFAGLVQYRKWVHVTIVFTPTHAKSFINGIYSGLVKMEDLYDMDKDILSATSYCYTKETYQHRLEKYSLAPAPLPPKWFKTSNSVPYYLNNTIVRVGALGIGLSFSGMAQHFIIYQNIELNEYNIPKIMSQYGHTELPTLSSLITDYKNLEIATHRTYQTFSKHETWADLSYDNNLLESNDTSVIYATPYDIEVKESMYLMKYDLNICPIHICGPVCLYNEEDFEVYKNKWMDIYFSSSNRSSSDDGDEKKSHINSTSNDFDSLSECNYVEEENVMICNQQYNKSNGNLNDTNSININNSSINRSDSCSLGLDSNSTLKFLWLDSRGTYHEFKAHLNGMNGRWNDQLIQLLLWKESNAKMEINSNKVYRLAKNYKQNKVQRRQEIKQRLIRELKRFVSHADNNYKSFIKLFADGQLNRALEKLNLDMNADIFEVAEEEDVKHLFKILVEKFGLSNEINDFVDEFFTLDEHDIYDQLDKQQVLGMLTDSIDKIPVDDNVYVLFEPLTPIAHSSVNVTLDIKNVYHNIQSRFRHKYPMHDVTYSYKFRLNQNDSDATTHDMFHEELVAHTNHVMIFLNPVYIVNEDYYYLQVYCDNDIIDFVHKIQYEMVYRNYTHLSYKNFSLFKEYYPYVGKLDKVDTIDSQNQNPSATKSSQETNSLVDEIMDYASGSIDAIRHYIVSLQGYISTLTWKQIVENILTNNSMRNKIINNKFVRRRKLASLFIKIPALNMVIINHTQTFDVNGIGLDELHYLKKYNIQRFAYLEDFLRENALQYDSFGSMQGMGHMLSHMLSKYEHQRDVLLKILDDFNVTLDAYSYEMLTNGIYNATENDVLYVIHYVQHYDRIYNAICMGTKLYNISLTELENSFLQNITTYTKNHDKFIQHCEYYIKEQKRLVLKYTRHLLLALKTFINDYEIEFSQQRRVWASRGGRIDIFRNPRVYFLLELHRRIFITNNKMDFHNDSISVQDERFFSHVCLAYWLSDDIRKDTKERYAFTHTLDVVLSYKYVNNYYDTLIVTNRNNSNEHRYLNSNVHLSLNDIRVIEKDLQLNLSQLYTNSFSVEKVQKIHHGKYKDMAQGEESNINEDVIYVLTNAYRQYYKTQEVSYTEGDEAEYLNRWHEYFLSRYAGGEDSPSNALQMSILETELRDSLVKYEVMLPFDSVYQGYRNSILSSTSLVNTMVKAQETAFPSKGYFPAPGSFENAKYATAHACEFGALTLKYHFQGNGDGVSTLSPNDVRLKDVDHVMTEMHDELEEANVTPMGYALANIFTFERKFFNHGNNYIDSKTLYPYVYNVVATQESQPRNSNLLVRKGIWHYWGIKANQNYTMALEYFQKAALMNNTEAMFCMGVMYDQGNEVQKNQTYAFELFTRATQGPVINPEALKAVGHFYMNGNIVEKNISMAEDYYKRSAKLGFMEAFYSLGNMYLDNKHYEDNCILGMHMLAIAANGGYFKAIYTLAFELSQANSQYGNCVREYARRQSLFDYNNMTARDAVPNETYLRYTRDLLEWGYTDSEGIRFVLPRSNRFIRILPPYDRQHPEIAMLLYQYIAQYHARRHALVDVAQTLYLNGEIVAANQFFEEISMYGSSIAQENVNYLTDKIISRYCYSEDKEEFDALVPWLNIFQYSRSGSHDLSHQHSDSISVKRYDNNSKNRSNSDADGSKTHTQDVQEWKLNRQCEMTFRRLSMEQKQRLINSQNAEVIHEIADMYHYGKYPLPKNPTNAALLYALAGAKFGNVESLVSLGVMLQNGVLADDGSYIVSRNLTAAKIVYEKALEYEIRFLALGHQRYTTWGVAPVLGLVATYSIQSYLDIFSIIWHSILPQDMKYNLKQTTQDDVIYVVGRNWVMLSFVISALLCVYITEMLRARRLRINT